MQLFVPRWSWYEENIDLFKVLLSSQRVQSVIYFKVLLHNIHILWHLPVVYKTEFGREPCRSWAFTQRYDHKCGVNNLNYWHYSSLDQIWLILCLCSQMIKQVTSSGFTKRLIKTKANWKSKERHILTSWWWMPNNNRATEFSSMYSPIGTCQRFHYKFFTCLLMADVIWMFVFTCRTFPPLISELKIPLECSATFLFSDSVVKVVLHYLLYSMSGRIWWMYKSLT